MARARPGPERGIAEPSPSEQQCCRATPPGCQRPRTTIAIARKPRPAVIRSANVPTWAKTSVAPPSPTKPPPIQWLPAGSACPDPGRPGHRRRLTGGADASPSAGTEKHPPD